MSEMTLEPCPFCGATDIELYPADRERTRWNVCCGNPGCVTRGDNDYLLESDAVAAWNRRANLSQPAQAVDVPHVHELIAQYWDLAYAEGKEGRTTDTAAGDAQRVLSEITRALSGENAGPVDGWLPIDTAPKGRRFIAYVPIESHRLVIAYIAASGIILDESLKPMPYPPFLWHELPDRPASHTPDKEGM